HKHTHTHTGTGTYTYTHTHIHTETHKHTHTSTYTHTHTHTHTVGGCTMVSEGDLRSTALAGWIGIACQKTITRPTGRAHVHAAHLTSDQYSQGAPSGPLGVPPSEAPSKLPHRHHMP